MGVVISKGFEL